MAGKTVLALCLLSLLVGCSYALNMRSVESMLDEYSHRIEFGRNLLQTPTTEGTSKEKSCAAAIEAHRYAIQALQVAETDDDSEVITVEMKSLVQEATNYAYGVSSNLLNVFDSTPYRSWANEIFQWILSNNLALPSSQIGEMMYIANTWMDQLAAIPENRTSQDLGELGSLLWSQLWYDYGDNLYQSAQTVEDRVSRRGMIMRAINYYFAAFYPNPTADQTAYRLGKAEKMFEEALELFTAYKVVTFHVPFNNGTATANISGTFATSLPGTKLPLMIFTTSPHNWKEMLFVRYGPGALRRGYSVIFIDGPGTGMTLREEPFMPVYSNWSAVIDQVIEYAFAHPEIADNADENNIVLAGASISGYLTAEACAGLANRIKACVLNPGFTSLAAAYNKIVYATVYRPLMSIALTSPSTFPNNELALKFRDPVNDILMPLLRDCDEDSEAPSVFAMGYQGDVLSPTMVHMSLGFLGAHAPESLAEVPEKLWAAHRRVNMEFGGYPVEDMNVPVMILVGILDGLAGDQVQELQSRLPDGAKKDSTMVIFNPEQGAALPSQLGAFALFEQEAYPWLLSILSGNGKK